ncbi:hypothetical protein B0J14DRAFT_702994 [Halenospora varia]|nr:hypothetical protein B0J14DRAFT_702994 [Halenospora varia]
MSPNTPERTSEAEEDDRARANTPTNELNTTPEYSPESQNLWEFYNKTSNASPTNKPLYNQSTPSKPTPLRRQTAPMLGPHQVIPNKPNNRTLRNPSSTQTPRPHHQNVRKRAYEVMNIEPTYDNMRMPPAMNPLRNKRTGRSIPGTLNDLYTHDPKRVKLSAAKRAKDQSHDHVETRDLIQHQNGLSDEAFEMGVKLSILDAGRSENLNAEDLVVTRPESSRLTEDEEVELAVKLSLEK